MQNKSVISFEKQKKFFVRQMAKVEKKGETKLILIIVANTLDPVIGKGCSLDIKTVTSTIYELARKMEFNLLELVIEGLNYNNENVVSAVESLKPDSDDIVIFYYTGHGFRFDKENNLLPPQLDLQSSPATNKIADIHRTTKNLNEIFEIIKNKGARLNLVIADCCNDEINFTRTFNKKDKKAAAAEEQQDELHKDTLREMFCVPTSSILVAAADKGLLSIVDDGVGSIFTLKFAQHLRKKLSSPLSDKNELHWDKLLEKIKEDTFIYSKEFDLPDGSPGNQMAFFTIESKAKVNY
jgi:hypothetical protein